MTTQPKFEPIGHLEYFRQDSHGLSFRIRRDETYWLAVRALISKIPGLKYNQTTGEFNTPPNSRDQVQLSIIFAEEWPIIQQSQADEITFEEAP